MGWGPGPAKISKTCPHCDVTSRKLPPKTKNVFFSISSRRLAKSVEGLNSSLALAAGDLWPKKGRPIVAVKGIEHYYGGRVEKYSAMAVLRYF